MKRWLVDSANNLHRMNNVGMNLMKDQLSLAYTDKNHATIESYFGNIAEEGNIAYKRANIDGNDKKPFTNVANVSKRLFMSINLLICWRDLFLSFCLVLTE